MYCVICDCIDACVHVNDVAHLERKRAFAQDYVDIATAQIERLKAKAAKPA